MAPSGSAASHAALEIIAEGGLTAAKGRTNARHVEIPCGTASSHHATLDGVLVAAFTLLGEQVEPRYNEVVGRVPDTDAVREVHVDVICGSG